MIKELIAVVAALIAMIAGLVFLWWRNRNTEALAIALIAYLDDNGGVPTYKELQPYVRSALQGRSSIL